MWSWFPDAKCSPQSLHKCLSFGGFLCAIALAWGYERSAIGLVLIVKQFALWSLPYVFLLVPKSVIAG
jgi:hypothetical protein